VSYTFRIRLALSGFVRINMAPETELPIKTGPNESVTLRAHQPDQALQNAEQLVLIGVGYTTEAAASEAGRRWHPLWRTGSNDPLLCRPMVTDEGPGVDRDLVNLDRRKDVAMPSALTGDAPLHSCPVEVSSRMASKPGCDNARVTGG
jgi:hypothetical protein